MDTVLRNIVLFEQVEGDAVEYTEVLCCIACAFAVQVFAEAHIQDPVQFVFDAPVLTDREVQHRRI